MKLFVAQTIRRSLPGARIMAFGSRIKGGASHYSDLDVAIDASQSVDLRVLSQIKEVFANSDVPFRIDVSDFHDMTPEFQQIVLDACEIL